MVVELLILLAPKLVGRVRPAYASAERNFGRVSADA